MSEKTIDITEKIKSVVESGAGVKTENKNDTNVVEESAIPEQNVAPLPTVPLPTTPNTQNTDAENMKEFLSSFSATPTQKSPKQKIKRGPFNKQTNSIDITNEIENYLSSTKFRNLVGDIIYDIASKSLSVAIKDAVEDIIDYYEEEIDKEYEAKQKYLKTHKNNPFPDKDDYLDYDDDYDDYEDEEARW